MNSGNKKVCFFGIFDPEYSRNRVLIRGFKENEYEISLCRVDPKEYPGVKKYFQLVKEYRKLKSRKFEHVIVAFPGHTVVWLAYILFGRKVIFDVFVSLYNSEIEDRKTHGTFSFKAFYYWSLDWYSMKLPKTLLIDTKTHQDFLSKKFKISKNKFIVVYVGSDDSIVYPKEKEGLDNFIVHFHGTGIPLQGVSYIVEAAEELEGEQEIRFRLYGVQGEDTKNISFLDRFEYKNMSNVLAEADIVLGIFGDTTKTQHVIPNKVYEAWAAKKPLISADTPAMRELVSNKKEILLCVMANCHDLAEKILFLKNDTILRNDMSEEGYGMSKEKLTPEILIRGLLQNLE